MGKINYFRIIFKTRYFVQKKIKDFELPSGEQLNFLIDMLLVFPDHGFIGKRLGMNNSHYIVRSLTKILTSPSVMISCANLISL